MHASLNTIVVAILLSTPGWAQDLSALKRLSAPDAVRLLEGLQEEIERVAYMGQKERRNALSELNPKRQFANTMVEAQLKNIRRLTSREKDDLKTVRNHIECMQQPTFGGYRRTSARLRKSKTARGDIYDYVYVRDFRESGEKGEDDAARAGHLDPVHFRDTLQKLFKSEAQLAKRQQDVERKLTYIRNTKQATGLTFDLKRQLYTANAAERAAFTQAVAGALAGYRKQVARVGHSSSQLMNQWSWAAHRGLMLRQRGKLSDGREFRIESEPARDLPTLICTLAREIVNSAHWSQLPEDLRNGLGLQEIAKAARGRGGRARGRRGRGRRGGTETGGSDIADVKSRFPALATALTDLEADASVEALQNDPLRFRLLCLREMLTSHTRMQTQPVAPLAAYANFRVKIEDEIWFEVTTLRESTGYFAPDHPFAHWRTRAAAGEEHTLYGMYGNARDRRIGLRFDTRIPHTRSVYSFYGPDTNYADARFRARIANVPAQIVMHGPFPIRGMRVTRVGPGCGDEDLTDLLAQLVKL